MAGVEGDTSGVSQDQLGSLLSYMQDREQIGSIFIGPPGSGKSALAKAVGNEAGVPTVQLDLGGMKGGLVGQSEERIRDALKVIDAISGGQAMWVATCNKIASIKPELRRRFTLGTFFFDLPDATEREAIWRIYLEKYELEADANVKAFSAKYDGWTGAEIRQCCDIAWRTGMSVDQSSVFVVPVSKSASGDISELRKQASGRFLSASKKGVYYWADSKAGGKRSVDVAA